MSTLQLENIKHPDASGNALELASDGTLGTVGNFGVGTGTPTKPLHVYGNSGNNHQILLENAYGSGSSWSLNAYGANGNLYIGNNLDRFVIDSSGRVTAPYQPSFCVTNSADTTQTWVSSDNNVARLLTFNGVVTNVGSHWDNTNSRFVAPVAGTYSFTASVGFYINAPNQVRDLNVIIRKNGTQIHWTAGTIPDFGSSNNHITIPINLNLTLNANDYVELWGRQYAQEGGTLRHYATTFAGQLIG